MGEHNRHKSVVESIKLKAYELWEKDGRKQGNDFDHWVNAEKTVMAKIKK